MGGWLSASRVKAFHNVRALQRAVLRWFFPSNLADLILEFARTSFYDEVKLVYPRAVSASNYSVRVLGVVGNFIVAVRNAEMEQKKLVIWDTVLRTTTHAMRVHGSPFLRGACVFTREADVLLKTHVQQTDGKCDPWSPVVDDVLTVQNDIVFTSGGCVTLTNTKLPNPPRHADFLKTLWIGEHQGANVVFVPDVGFFSIGKKGIIFWHDEPRAVNFEECGTIESLTVCGSCLVIRTGLQICVLEVKLASNLSLQTKIICQYHTPAVSHTGDWLIMEDGEDLTFYCISDRILLRRRAPNKHLLRARQVASRRFVLYYQNEGRLFDLDLSSIAFRPPDSNWSSCYNAHLLEDGRLLLEHKHRIFLVE